MLGSDLKPRSITTVTDLGCWVLPSTWRSLKDHRVIRSHPNKAVDLFTNKTSRCLLAFALSTHVGYAIPSLASRMRLLGMALPWWRASCPWPTTLLGEGRGATDLVSLCVDAGKSGSISEKPGRGAVSGVSAQAGGFRGQSTAIANQQGGRHDDAAATGRERPLYSGAVRTGHRLTAVWITTVRARREECEEACGGSGGAEISGTVASAVGQRRGV